MIRSGLLVLLLALVPNSCVGTLHSRVHPEQPGELLIGWPLYEAVRADFEMILEGPSGHSFHWWFGALLGWPLDLFLDTVLLPVDVVAGIAGCSTKMSGAAK